MDGIINIYKEKGYTSHDVVAIVRKTIKTKTVGHTGTLDPDAEGVLPVVVGKATKISDFITNTKKTYVATIYLGATTTTQDGSGEIISQTSVSIEEKDHQCNETKIITPEIINQVLNSFIGEQKQIPPMYSAIKINGQKLYDLARKGVEVERKPREVTIYSIKLLEINPPNTIKIETECSKGTYIRTLCADIGESLGCGAYMSYLVRTKSGSFDISDAIKLSRLKELAAEGATNYIIPLEQTLSNLENVTVKNSFAKALFNGNRLPPESIKEKIILNPGQELLVFDEENKLVGIYIVDMIKSNLFIKPHKMLL